MPFVEFLLVDVLSLKSGITEAVQFKCTSYSVRTATLTHRYLQTNQICKFNKVFLCSACCGYKEVYASLQIFYFGNNNYIGMQISWEFR